MTYFNNRVLNRALYINYIALAIDPFLDIYIKKNRNQMGQTKGPFDFLETSRPAVAHIYKKKPKSNGPNKRPI